MKKLECPSQEQAAAAEWQCQLQTVTEASEKAKAMLAYQNAQFAAACLVKLQSGRCEGCGQ